MRDDLEIKHQSNKSLWSCACGFITASEQAWRNHCDIHQMPYHLTEKPVEVSDE